MLSTATAWAALVFDAAGVLVGIIAAIVYLVAFRRTRNAAADSAIAIPTGAVHRWLLVNALFLIVTVVNSVRWLVINDMPKVMGVPATGSGIDDLTWAVIDMVLILMPLILIGHIVVNLRRAQPPHE